MIRMPVSAYDVVGADTYREFSELIWQYLRDRITEYAELNCMMIAPDAPEGRLIRFADHYMRPAMVQDAAFVICQLVITATG